MMKPNLRRLILAAIALAALGGGTGVAFAMWIDHGDRLFLTLAQTGLAWCL